MKQLLLSILLSLCFQSNSDRTVYVCESHTAYAYHLDRYCKGLQKCTHTVILETESQAIHDNRKACNICVHLRYGEDGKESPGEKEAGQLR